MTDRFSQHIELKPYLPNIDIGHIAAPEPEIFVDYSKKYVYSNEIGLEALKNPVVVAFIDRLANPALDQSKPSNNLFYSLAMSEFGYKFTSWQTQRATVTNPETGEESKLVRLIGRSATIKNQDHTLIDPQTNAFNQHAFEAIITNTPPELNQNNGVCLFFDLDNLKKVNDENKNHDAGDQIIKNLANALFTNLRTSDLIFRRGGDEFVALLPNTSTEENEKVVDRLNKYFIERNIKVSFGSASWGPQSEFSNISEAVVAADKKMYQAKQERKKADTRPQTFPPGTDISTFA